MKVWIVKIGCDYEGSSVEGIYDSEEKAESRRQYIDQEIAKEKRIMDAYRGITQYLSIRNIDWTRIDLQKYVLDRFPKGSFHEDFVYVMGYEVQ